MDRRERVADPLEQMRVVFEGLMSGVYTALPGIVEAFDEEAITATIQPALRGSVQRADGSWLSVQLPLLTDVPCQFPGGGGATLTFPVKAGDECLVIFASRCIDAWHQSGGVQEAASTRMHSLSDGMALLGFRSTPRTLTGVSTTATELRADDGLTRISLDPVAKTVGIVAPGGIAILGPTTVNGVPI